MHAQLSLHADKQTRGNRERTALALQNKQHAEQIARLKAQLESLTEQNTALTEAESGSAPRR